MFEVGFQELLLISVVALVVLGPERLPKVLRQVGRWVGKARSMARQFREQLESEVDLDDLTRNNTSPRRPPATSATGDTVGGAEPAAADTSVSDALSTAHLPPEGGSVHPVDDVPSVAETPVDAPVGPPAAAATYGHHHPENDVYGAAPVSETIAGPESDHESREPSSAVHDRSG
jgi:sec-independent protein translocase protein TatB